MKESIKTISFVAGAGILGLAALVNSSFGEPGESSEKSLVGKAFYEDFTSTESARSLQVTAMDAESGSPIRFSVENRNGLWRIPSEHNYPAEAAARIAQTSSSILGLKREALVGRDTEDFAKFGVLDPLDEELDDPDNAGKRITLKDKDGEVVADYIIGKKIEAEVSLRPGEGEFERQNEQPDYYLRRADENETWRVAFDVDLSTKFSDWIDPDLLRIDPPEITQIEINNYAIRAGGMSPMGIPQLEIQKKDDFVINRETAADPWIVEGMNPEREEVKKDRVDEIVDVLDSIEIVGVRPKFQFNNKSLLTADLGLADLEELRGDIEKQAAAVQAMQEDLSEKGFNLAGTRQKLELVSDNGELSLGTSRGVRYHLHIGTEADDAEKEIELGDGGDAKEEKEKEEDADAGAAGDKEEPNRYLFVRVQFDETLLGDRPTEPEMPVAPEKPEGYVPAGEEPETPAAKTPDAKTAEGEKSEQGSDGDKPEDEKADEKDFEDGDEKEASKDEPAEEEKPAGRDARFVAYDEAVKQFEQGKTDFELAKTRFEQDVKTFAEKVEEGQKRVKELNERFGEWYYVVSAANLETIQSQRLDVVTIKAPPAPAPPGMPPGGMPPGMGGIPGMGSIPGMSGIPGMGSAKKEEPQEDDKKEGVEEEAPDQGAAEAEGSKTEGAETEGAEKESAKTEGAETEAPSEPEPTPDDSDVPDPPVEAEPESGGSNPESVEPEKDKTDSPVDDKPEKSEKPEKTEKPKSESDSDGLR